jgi:hypothetical protein
MTQATGMRRTKTRPKQNRDFQFKIEQDVDYEFKQRDLNNNVRDIKWLRDGYNRDAFHNDYCDHTKNFYQHLQDMYINDKPLFSDPIPQKFRSPPNNEAQFVHIKPFLQSAQKSTPKKDFIKANKSVSAKRVPNFLKATTDYNLNLARALTPTRPFNFTKYAPTPKNYLNSTLPKTHPKPKTPQNPQNPNCTRCDPKQSLALTHQ